MWIANSFCGPHIYLFYAANWQIRFPRCLERFDHFCNDNGQHTWSGHKLRLSYPFRLEWLYDGGFGLSLFPVYSRCFHVVLLQEMQSRVYRRNHTKNHCQGNCFICNRNRNQQFPLHGTTFYMAYSRNPSEDGVRLCAGGHTCPVIERYLENNSLGCTAAYRILDSSDCIWKYNRTQSIL